MLESVSRADELGLLRDFLPSQRLLTLAEAERALRHAVQAGASRGGTLERMTREWYERFLDEYPGARPGTAPSALAPRLVGASAGVGYHARWGAATAGRGIYPPDRTGAIALEDRRGMEARGALAVAVGPALAVQVEPHLTRDGVEVDVADLVLGWRAWTVAVGRQRVGYGWFESGGVVLSGWEPLDRAELATRRPILLPGPLRAAGPIAVHTFLTRLDGDRHPGDPFLWGGRIAVQPHHRFSVAIHRAAMFGGSGSNEPITAKNILGMLVGTLGGRGFENQVVAVAGRLELPTDAVLPLTAYLEWGSEDAAGAWRDVPGIVAGLRTPMLPKLPAVSAGVELASMAQSCCGNPPWYRHTAFEGSWAGRDRPLGHPLGGSGWEAVAFAGVDLPRSGVRADMRLFRRERREENLFSPERAGAATGGAVEAAWRPSPGSEVYLVAGREAGDGWTDERMEIGGRVFPRGLR